MASKEFTVTLVVKRYPAKTEYDITVREKDTDKYVMSSWGHPTEAAAQKTIAKTLQRHIETRHKRIAKLQCELAELEAMDLTITRRFEWC